MKDIRFYDFDFNLVYIVSDWISLNWELKYNGVGTFELQLPPLSGVGQLVMDNPHLVAIQGDRQAVITGRMLDEVITLYGRTPNWLLGKRVVMPFEQTVTTDIQTLIRKKLAEVIDAEDKIALSSPIDGFKAIDEYTLNSPKSLLTFICEGLEKEQAGHRLKFEPAGHRWLFEIYRGEEKPIILSQANNNAHSPKYTQDILKKANGIYYKDNGTGEYKEIASGEKGILRWYDISRADNRADAISELEALKENTALTFDTTDLEYGKHYGLGDVFYVETEFGGQLVRRANRVTEVRIWDEALNKGQRPLFAEKEADEDSN